MGRPCGFQALRPAGAGGAALHPPTFALPGEREALHAAALPAGDGWIVKPRLSEGGLGLA
jgi:hypothetical protein